jgi:hypothetical protein
MKCRGAVLALLFGLLLSGGNTALAAARAQQPAVPHDTAPAPADSGSAPSPVWSNPVSPTRAVIFSPLFPGWGQLYSENSWRAALAFGAEMFYWSRMLMNDRKAEREQDFSATLEPGLARDRLSLQVEEYRQRVRDFAWWSLGAMLIIALDAYVDAHLFQFDQDPVPVPHRWELSLGAGDLRPDAAAAPQLVVFQWRTTF